MKAFFLLLLLVGDVGVISQPGEVVEVLYSPLMRALKTNILFAGLTSHLSPPSVSGNALGLLLSILFSTRAKVRKKIV